MLVGAQLSQGEEGLVIMMLRILCLYLLNSRTLPFYCSHEDVYIPFLIMPAEHLLHACSLRRFPIKSTVSSIPSLLA